MIIYTDGGCSGNNFKDLSKRKMIAVATDEFGIVLVDKHQDGGSNNIAELMAVKEALMWCVTHNVKKVLIMTDSTNNLKWVWRGRVGKNVNDRASVLNLQTAISGLRQSVEFDLKWIPREQNVAGHYIENKYSL